MGEFSATWLALREPFDHAARSEALLSHLSARFSSEIRVLSLGAGTGSGMRWLGPRLGRRQQWTLVDRDPALLEIAATLPTGAQWTGQTHGHDLRDLRGLDLPADLICCQALLDLVSERWLTELADWLTGRAVPFLAALTVDGRVTWSPTHPLDESIHEAFRTHQRLDLDGAPKPSYRATSLLEALLRERSWTVFTARSDWEISAAHIDMLEAMIHGMAEAARETHPDPGCVDDWAAERRTWLRATPTSLQVGHLDLLALPPPGNQPPETS